MFCEYMIDMIVLVIFDMSNFGGKMYGGELLKLLDKVVYICVMCYCGIYVVIFLVDKVLFKEFIVIGELVLLKVVVNYIGWILMEVGIWVVVENLEIGSVCYINFCYFIMVVVDKVGVGKFIWVLSLVFFIDEE